MRMTNLFRAFSFMMPMALAALSVVPQAQAHGKIRDNHGVAAAHQELIALRHVPASLMAWWLDLEHGAKPAFVEWSARAQQTAHPQAAPSAGANPQQPATSSTNNKLDVPEGVNNATTNEQRKKDEVFFGGPAAGVKKIRAAMEARQARAVASAQGSLGLPEGVDQIVAIDAQNAILVIGTTEGVNQVRKIVDLLDKPIQQVQLDVRVIEAPANAFGGLNEAGRATDTVYVLMPGKKLDDLLQLGTARVVNIGRVSTPNNMAARFAWETSFSGTVRTLNEKGAPLLQSSVLADSLRLILTPTLNRDNTITVAMLTQSELKSEGDAPLSGFSSAVLSASGVNTISNLKIGDALIVGGLHPNIAPTKEFSILPFGTVANVDAPIAAKDQATPKADTKSKELYIEITASLLTPQS